MSGYPSLAHIQQWHGYNELSTGSPKCHLGVHEKELAIKTHPPAKYNSLGPFPPPLSTLEKPEILGRRRRREKS